MKLEADIGADEIKDNLFQVIVSDIESGETVALVCGKTSDEAFERANLIVDKFNAGDA